MFRGAIVTIVKPDAAVRFYSTPIQLFPAIQLLNAHPLDWAASCTSRSSIGAHRNSLLSRCLDMPAARCIQSSVFCVLTAHVPMLEAIRAANTNNHIASRIDCGRPQRATYSIWTAFVYCFGSNAQYSHRPPQASAAFAGLDPKSNWSTA